MRTIILFLFIITCFEQAALSQGKSNRGKEFWLAYGYNFSFTNEFPTNAQELVLYISAELATNVTVSISNTTFTQTFAIPANSVNASIVIPKTGTNDARTLQDGLQTRGIHIVSSEPVAVYAHVYSTMVSGATMLMPVETYGYAYQSVNYYQDRSESNPAEWYSWFFVIASEDNTRVRITPSDSTKNGWLPGNNYEITLNKGESYHVFGKAVFNDDPASASKDMTGSKAVSIPGSDGQCHPIALFSGSSGIRLCRGDGGEFMHQQMFPIQAWGTRYLTYHTINNTNSSLTQTNRNYYRVCITDPSTQVRRNGILLTGLVNNFFYEFMDSTGGDYITANQPILVAQYTPNKNQCWNFPTSTPAPPSYGDPEMFYLSPIEQGQKSVLFYTSRLSAIDYVYVNIYLPSNGISSLLIDGNPIPAAQIINHPNLAGYSVALARITGPSAQHRITCDSAFNATVYGLGNYESYGYNVGTAINNLNQYGAFNNIFSSAITDSATCLNSPLRLKVKLSFQPSQLTWKRSAVSTMFPNTDTIVNNPVATATELINNRLYYVYSLPSTVTFTTAGNFTIPVHYRTSVNGNCSDTGTVSISIKVKQGPIASFSFTNPVCTNNPVTFTGNSQTTGFSSIRYEWLFSDASTQSTINAIKTFTISQNEAVKYRIITAEGCIDDTAQTVTVSPKPKAGFDAAALLCAGDSILVTDTSSISGGTITNWNWSWSNSGQLSATNPNPFYIPFTTTGNPTIKLVVTSAVGCISDTAFKSINVLPVPTAQFQANLIGCSGNQVQLVNQSIPNGTNIQTWTWSFGNSIQDIRNDGNIFTYTYPLAGNYNIGLTVSATNGCSSIAFVQPVVVGGLPVSDFSYSGKRCVDSTFQFESSIPNNGGSQVSWHWFFGDGQQAVVNNSNAINHIYSLPLVNIRIGHFVTISGCATDTVWIGPLDISGNPMIGSVTAPPRVCSGSLFSINASANSGLTNWIWETPSGIIETAPPLEQSLNTPGNYTFGITAENSEGCRSAEENVSIQVDLSPVVNAGPDIFLQEGGSAIIAASVTPPGSVSYQWLPSFYLSNAAILQPITTTPDDQTYVLKATDLSTGCSDSDIVVVKVMNDIYIPNAFTPDGNGNNDTWKIPALEAYPGSLVRIYNRFGQLIYESEGSRAAWNGRWNGIDQPAGTYVYKIITGKVKDKILSGTIILIR